MERERERVSKLGFLRFSLVHLSPGCTKSTNFSDGGDGDYGGVLSLQVIDCYFSSVQANAQIKVKQIQYHVMSIYFAAVRFLVSITFAPMLILCSLSK